MNDDVVTGQEIANRLFVPRSRVAMWRKRKTQDFPDPVASRWPSRAPLWAWDDVAAWWGEYDVNANRGGKGGNRGNRAAIPPKKAKKPEKRERAIAQAEKAVGVDFRSRMLDVNSRRTR